MVKQKNHLSIAVRKELAEYLIRLIMRKNPELSVVQIRRVFCYSYFTLSTKDFDNYYKKQKRLIHEEDN